MIQPHRLGRVLLIDSPLTWFVSVLLSRFAKASPHVPKAGGAFAPTSGPQDTVRALWRECERVCIFFQIMSGGV